MSGPKYSDFSVQEEQRRRQEAERQRRIQEERRRQEMNWLDHEIEQAHDELSQLRRELAIYAQSGLDQAKEMGLDAYYIEPVQHLRDQLLRQIDAFPGSYSVRDVDPMRSYLQGIGRLLSQTRQTMNGKLRLHSDRLTEYAKQVAYSRAEQEFLAAASELEVKRRQSLDLKRESHIHTPVHFPGAPKPVEVNLDEAVAVFEAAVEPYLNSPFIESKHEIYALYDSVHALFASQQADQAYLASLIESRTKAFLSTKKRYDVEIERRQAQEEKRTELYLTYTSVAALLRLAPDETLAQTADTATAIRTLESQITALQEQLRKKEEQEYIAETVNEVMRELGYEIIATDTIQTPKRNVLHNMYGLADNTAVNVMTSDNGSILFEVTGYSDEPRELTSRDKLQIKESMELFCTNYSAVREKLMEKGIVIANENLAPPDEKYARIVDTRNKTVLKKTKDQTARRPAEPKRMTLE
ncbi:hypothetical protein [Brevibacillus dissolubilis]|uniref:hypothetical protein n=1 Tax=Brevibacillus dissolubilis TaxID=1844116 RepID=UPI0011160E29|nr:hypothetical protein [Brevibacillus dissolubilis]